MKLTIFYSWQNTTEAKYNRYFILNCIKKAVKKLKNKPELKSIEFEIQEGISNEPGSPGVASKIIDERIPKCDIFIADLSVVNSLPNWKKKLQKLIGIKYKPVQNNNVIFEYGVAYNKLGLERIIGVLNKSYGSPHENDENIPFDIKHLRFPIEYTYSSQSNDKSNIQKGLVSDLANAIKDVALFAIKHQKEKFRPFLTWEQWKQEIDLNQEYYDNDKTNEIRETIIEGIKKTRESIRIIGLSGLGKTRLLFEIFQPDESNPDSILLSSKILYINYNFNPNFNYQSFFSKLIIDNEDRILIIDNCPRDLHKNLLHHLDNVNNKLKLITIDSNPEEIDLNPVNNVDYILIKKDDLGSIVEQILEKFNFIGKEKIEKIKEFAQGIPLMAVLMVNSIKEDSEQFIGKLTDRDLLNKLLGKQGEEPNNRTILKSCALFNYFGFEEEKKTQLKFIATNKNITSLNGDDTVIINGFRKVCNIYLKREIFEKRGRFIGMRPFPLAMYLTKEWLDESDSERVLNVINDLSKLEEPDKTELIESFAERMKYLGYADKAVLIVNKIIGVSSPFDNAEVLNTKLGSRLFRSFVEVNPVAVLNNFIRNIFPLSKDELLNIVEGRRNIIWVLEKICFDRRTFVDGAKILCKLAIAENETWSNNATGQFLQLFNILLPGTEVNLIDRWKVIEWMLNQKENDYLNLALKAMNIGLKYGHFSRMGGAEKQGTKILQDYQPTYDDIKDYWTKILSELTKIATSDNEYSEFASEIIANNFRGACRARLGNLYIPYLEIIINHKKNDWDKGLKGLKFARKYEKAFLTVEELSKINEFIKSLTKTDFKSKYLTLSNSYYLEEDETYSLDNIKKAVIKLADEFIEKKLSWEEYLPLFYTNQQINSFYFGQRLYELVKEDSNEIRRFIDLSLKIIASIEKEKRNLTVLGGFISESDNNTKDEFYNTLFKNNQLNYLLFYFVSIDKQGKKYYDLLFNLVDTKKLDIINFESFNYSNSLSNCNINELEDFANKLFTYGDYGYVLVFDIYFNLTFSNKELKLKLIPIFKQCIYQIGFNRKITKQLDGYKWSEIIREILSDEKESDFALFINKSIIESISWENSYHLNHDVQNIYEVLLTKHFRTIWDDLSNALLSENENYIKFYGLKHILGSHIEGVFSKVGVLFKVDNIDAIFAWCKNNKPLAPIRLAELVPIFGNNNDDYASWHPVTKRLIEEFGNIEDVLKSLSTNMGSYSWTGSIVPLLKSKKQLFESLLNHKYNEVVDWAKRNIKYLEEEIKREKYRDEEMFL